MRQKCKGKRWHFSLNWGDSSPTSHRWRQTRKLHSPHYWDHLEELIHNLIPAQTCRVVRFLQTTLENFRQAVSQSSPACQYFQWMKNEHGGVNKAIWPEGPGILRISVSCGEKMKHLPVCNPISWWLSVDIGLLREWAGCSGCWRLMRNRLRARGHFWDLTMGAKETHQHLDTYCPKSFRGSEYISHMHNFPL